MKKIFPAVLLLICLPAISQQLESVTKDKPKRCATAEVIENRRQLKPQMETDAQFETWLAGKIAERKRDKEQGKITPGVIVPVVFHIIHDNEAVGTGRNISQALINQQLIQLNKDYANLSQSPYGSVAEDMGIQFALAQRDPAGNTLAEPGIDRINRSNKTWTAPPYTVGYASASDDYLTNTIKPNSIWDPSRYINIWVSEWEAGILGIATFPASSTLSGLDNSETNLTAGMAIGYGSVGSAFMPQDCGPFASGRTLTHEMGHFLGLRHIWGDANCGTDYCGDTPVHETSNNGVPTHPKPNSCGTTDEMFENYMDYTDDIAMNTFTVNQGDRMEAVMANSPRRGSLATSNVGLVPASITNNIQFEGCTNTLFVYEKSTGTTCPRYTDVKFSIIVDNAATASTSVTMNTAGTAVNGRHYQLMTPALDFNAGDNLKEGTIRIFDDAVAEANRTITLSYSIGSGGGVSAGSAQQTFIITIGDDDFNAGINGTPTEVTLMSQNFGTTTGSNQVPAGWTSTNGQGTTNKWVVNAQNTPSGFTSVYAHVSNGNTASVTNGSAALAYTANSATDARLYTSSVDATGLKNVKLSFDYVCNGEIYQGEAVDLGLVYFSTNGTNYSALRDVNGNVVILQGVTAKTSLTLNLPDSCSGKSNISFMFRWINDNSVRNNPPFAIDNVVVKASRQAVETAVNSAKTESVKSSTANYFYTSGDGDLIAALKNVNQDLNCITGTVTGAGNGKKAIVVNSGNYFRTDKVIQLTPATANTAATYQVTLYYTVAELSSAWTPGEIATLKILKIKDGVNLNGPVSGTDAKVVAPIFEDHSADGYYSYTGTFTGGFSQFMLSSVPEDIILPVQLLTFEAMPAGRAIALKWETAQEINNKGFAIERSTGGSQYEQIGWVDGKGTTASRSAYDYTDVFVQPGIVYSYRLRQLDFDGRVDYSAVRQAKIGAEGAVIVNLSPNPASDNFRLFVTGSGQKGEISLHNSQGQLVRQWGTQALTGAPLLLSVKGLSAGLYLVSVVSEGKKYTEKLLIR